MCSSDLPSKADANAADWIGIMATRINAQLLKACFGDYCKNDVVYNPTVEDLSFDGQVLVASGWKPGFSTDTDAVYLGEKFDGKVIVNLSNIEKVYTDDPRKILMQNLWIILVGKILERWLGMNGLLEKIVLLIQLRLKKRVNLV